MSLEENSDFKIESPMVVVVPELQLLMDDDDSANPKNIQTRNTAEFEKFLK